MQLEKLTANAQTQAATFRFRSEQRFEDAVPNIRRDAVAGVAKDDHILIGTMRRLHRQFSSTRRGLCRIEYEIVYHLLQLARIESISWLSDSDTPPDAATALVGDMKVLIPFGAFIDKEAEIKRLQREMEKLQKDLDRTNGKLANPNFVDKAPADVVDKERQRLVEMETAQASLQEQLGKIESL